MNEANKKKVVKQEALYLIPSSHNIGKVISQLQEMIHSCSGVVDIKVQKAGTELELAQLRTDLADEQMKCMKSYIKIDKARANLATTQTELKELRDLMARGFNDAAEALLEPIKAELERYKKALFAVRRSTEIMEARRFAEQALNQSL